MESRPLKIARNTSLFVFLIGAVLLTVGLACGGDDKSPAATASATSSPTDTATPTATATSTPTPTPTPFNGKVARLKLPRFGIDAPIEELSVDSTNTMETPTNENVDVGWYNSEIMKDGPYLGSRPGWDGNAVFSAHVYYHSIPAPFQKLAQSQIGDHVVIDMENGLEYTYEVIDYKRYHRDTIPMGDVITPPTRPANEQWITLITCGGQLDSTGQEYISRDVVVAKRIA